MIHQSMPFRFYSIFQKIAFLRRRIHLYFSKNSSCTDKHLMVVGRDEDNGPKRKWIVLIYCGCGRYFWVDWDWIVEEIFPETKSRDFRKLTSQEIIAIDKDTD